jgi:lipoate---protein ligase
MIREGFVVRALRTEPARNLAVESCLLETVPDGAYILYLWQNSRTVVIGRNQNAWKECRVDQLAKDGGWLVRRLSGGGAVYHDMGNLNFTFLVAQKDYDLARQQEIILRAVRSFGLAAEATGRNDIEIGGRKFSGNAFYRSGDRAYHHGTLLIDADMEQMSKYLNVPSQKLEGRGIQSVKSRVVNLSSLSSGITVPSISEAMIHSFGEVCGFVPKTLPETGVDAARAAELEARFGSWDWNYGRSAPFTCSFSRRFPWGNAEVCLDVTDGVVADCAIYSDAMDSLIISRVARSLVGQPFCKADMILAAEQYRAENEQVITDIQTLISEQNF